MSTICLLAPPHPPGLSLSCALAYILHCAHMCISSHTDYIIAYILLTRENMWDFLSVTGPSVNVTHSKSVHFPGQIQLATELFS